MKRGEGGYERDGFLTNRKEREVNGVFWGEVFSVREKVREKRKGEGLPNLIIPYLTWYKIR